LLQQQTKEKLKIKAQPYDPFQSRVVIKDVKEREKRYAGIGGADQSCSDVGEIKILYNSKTSLSCQRLKIGRLSQSVRKEDPRCRPKVGRLDVAPSLESIVGGDKSEI
jgi:hypothetical protein